MIESLDLNNGAEKPVFRQEVRYFPASDQSAEELMRAINSAIAGGKGTINHAKARENSQGLWDNLRMLGSSPYRGMQIFSDDNPQRPYLSGSVRDETTGESLTLEVTYKQGVLYLKNVPFSYVKQGEIPQTRLQKFSHGFVRSVRNLFARRSLSQSEFDELFHGGDQEKS